MQDGLVGVIHFTTWDFLALINNDYTEGFAESPSPPRNDLFKLNAKCFSSTYPKVWERFLLFGSLHKKQLSFPIEHNCAGTYYVDILMFEKVVALRYRILLQRGWVVERR